MVLLNKRVKLRGGSETCVGLWGDNHYCLQEWGEICIFALADLIVITQKCECLLKYHWNTIGMQCIPFPAKIMPWKGQ